MMPHKPDREFLFENLTENVIINKCRTYKGEGKQNKKRKSCIVKLGHGPGL
jgi:hypothetical protein